LNSAQVLFQRFIPTWTKYNSVIRLKHDVRRKRIKELGQLGLNQAQIAEEMGLSYSTVKREIKAINEDLE
jgi:DNA-binding NarL/FixJ family response regulator